MSCSLLAKFSVSITRTSTLINVPGNKLRAPGLANIPYLFTQGLWTKSKSVDGLSRRASGAAPFQSASHFLGCCHSVGCATLIYMSIISSDLPASFHPTRRAESRKNHIPAEPYSVEVYPCGPFTYTPRCTHVGRDTSSAGSR